LHGVGSISPPPNLPLDGARRTGRDRWLAPEEKQALAQLIRVGAVSNRERWTKRLLPHPHRLCPHFGGQSPASPQGGGNNRPLFRIATGFMGGDRNRVRIVSKTGVEDWPDLGKEEVVERLVVRIAEGLDK